MPEYTSLIARHRDALNSLHGDVQVTFRTKTHSAKHEKDWKDACRAFQEFESEVDRILRTVNVQTICANEKIREFVFDFLSVDPIYFRSGYEKERLLRLLKPVKLTEFEKQTLRQIILRRIRTGALREFRKFCQMIPRIQTEDFLNDLRDAGHSGDQHVKRRARFALTYANVRAD
ncbi:hypothetical protein [Marivita hallyeonensis]|uniref:Uncharacterized protein n=1 Tax=Marivita hallyeonensis TaxID=996342 RepID=A0A1M5MTN3_9RHOB|nr:hypothetical protein [Marivita hallyeonensis]SHG80631.1 hypothetical protein SAMN05443551_0648 [Marivita hallyeonensis]